MLGEAAASAVQMLKVREHELYVRYVKGAPVDPDSLLASRPTTIFFLHGYGGESAQFDEQITTLSSRGFNVVAMDMVGHGKSSHPEEEHFYSAHEIMQDFAAVYQIYQGSNNVLVGHSYGAALVTFLSVRLRNVMCVALLSIAYENPLPTNLLHVLPDFAFGGIRMLLGMGGERSMAVERMVHPSASADLRRRQMELGRRNSTFVLSATGANAEWPERVDFEKLTMPVLMIHGRGDQITPPQSARPVSKFIRSLQDWVIIDNAGHSVMMEKAERVSDAIATFVTDTIHGEMLNAGRD